MHTRHSVKITLADCSARPLVKVIPNLAHTAADVSRLAQKGVPVNSVNMESLYFDGYLPRQVQPEVEFTRGYDVNVAWEEQCKARDNIRQGKKAARLHRAVKEYIDGKSDKNPLV